MVRRIGYLIEQYGAPRVCLRLIPISAKVLASLCFTKRSSYNLKAKLPNTT